LVFGPGAFFGWLRLFTAGLATGGFFFFLTGRELGKGEAAPLIRTLAAGDGFLSQSSKSLHFGLGDATEIDTKSQLPLPSLDYVTFDGRRHSLTAPSNGDIAQPILLNLWASWCPNCQAELKEWTARAGDIKAAGIRVLAISVDGLNGNQSASLAPVKKVIEQIGFPFEAGMATANTVEKLVG